MGTSTTNSQVNIGGDFVILNAVITTTTSSGTTATNNDNIVLTVPSSLLDVTIENSNQLLPILVCTSAIATYSPSPGIKFSLVIRAMLHPSGDKYNLVQDSLILSDYKQTGFVGPNLARTEVKFGTYTKVQGTFKFWGQVINVTNPPELRYYSDQTTILPLGGVLTGNISVVPFTVTPNGMTESYTVSTLNAKGVATGEREQVILMTPSYGNIYDANCRVVGRMEGSQGYIDAVLHIQMLMDIQIAPVSQGLDMVKMSTPAIKSIQIVNPCTYYTTLDTQIRIKNQDITATSNTLKFVAVRPFVVI